MDAHSRRMEVLKEIPPLLPQFLRKRRVGLPVVGRLMQETGLDRPTLFMLPQLYNLQGSYGGAAVSAAQVRAYDPYSTMDTFSGPLAVLVERGFAAKDDEGNYSLTRAGEEIVMRLHAAGRAYVARTQPLSGDDLGRLADELGRAVDGIMDDPVLAPRHGSHLAAYRTLAIGNDESAMERIEQAVLELWGARDDAHMRAWREAGLEGPAMAVLTRVWSGEGHTLGDLQNALSGQQAPEDVEGSLSYLVEKEYAARDGDAVSLTPAGVVVREDIESETDRVYFAPWPHTLVEAEWVRDQLRVLVEKLPVTAAISAR